jgi:hypothetical protein
MSIIFIYYFKILNLSIAKNSLSPIYISLRMQKIGCTSVSLCIHGFFLLKAYRDVLFVILYILPLIWPLKNMPMMHTELLTKKIEKKVNIQKLYTKYFFDNSQ